MRIRLIWALIPQYPTSVQHAHRVIQVLAPQCLTSVQHCLPRYAQSATVFDQRAPCPYNKTYKDTRRPVGRNNLYQYIMACRDTHRTLGRTPVALGPPKPPSLTPDPPPHTQRKTHIWHVTPNVWFPSLKPFLLSQTTGFHLSTGRLLLLLAGAVQTAMRVGGGGGGRGGGGGDEVRCGNGAGGHVRDADGLVLRGGLRLAEYRNGARRE
eukprot:1908083-Rhodomonas_salina.1